MKKLLDLLSSLRLTLGLLVALAAFFLLGLAVPQKALLRQEIYGEWQRESPALVAFLEALGFTDIHRSGVALVLWTAFFLNLAVVMVRRAPGIVRRTRIDGAVPDPESPGFAVRRVIRVPGVTLGTVRASFERRGFALHAEGERLRAVKNRFAPLATIAFHLSFFLVAAGGVTTALTRFEGNVDLGQGEEFTGALARYAMRPNLPRFGEPPRARFIVEAIEPEVEGNVPTGVRVRIRDERGILRTLEINHPYEAGGAAFVFKNLGVAPFLVLVDATGAERFAGFMRLNVMQGRTDTFSLIGLRFTAKLFPEHFVEGATEGTRSQQMRDPVLRLTAEAPSGREISASLRPGEAMALGPYTLAFVDWRYWVRLYVRAERGIGIIWAGFLVGAAALVWRLFLYRREYVVAVVPPGDGEGSRVIVAARSEYYRALFADEAEGTISAIAEELAAAVPVDGRAGGSPGSGA